MTSRFVHLCAHCMHFRIAKWYRILWTVNTFSPLIRKTWLNIQIRKFSIKFYYVLFWLYILILKIDAYIIHYGIWYTNIMHKWKSQQNNNNTIVMWIMSLTWWLCTLYLDGCNCDKHQLIVYIELKWWNGEMVYGLHIRENYEITTV